MQVYRGLDIGTAKPSAAEQARVRHHLIDLVELTEQFDAAKFRTLAAAAVEDIVRRGRVPIFCGGTGLYFKAFLDGLGEAARPLIRPCEPSLKRPRWRFCCANCPSAIPQPLPESISAIPAGLFAPWK